jgi:hypothetical protein
VFRLLEQHLRKEGSITPPAGVSAVCPWSIWMPATEDAVIAAMKQEPLRSSCFCKGVGTTLSIQALVLNILYNDELHPYHYLPNQHQLSEDTPLRMQFCERLHQQHAADALYEYILWTVEAYFMCEGVFSIYSSHLWSQANPHATRACGYQACFIISEWVAICGGHPCGPLPATMSAGCSTILCFSSNCFARAT